MHPLINKNLTFEDKIVTFCSKIKHFSCNKCLVKESFDFVSYLSECAVVGHNDDDDEMSDSSYTPDNATDSDEEFTPYKKRKAKIRIKSKQGAKLLQRQDKQVRDIKLTIFHKDVDKTLELCFLKE